LDSFITFFTPFHFRSRGKGFAPWGYLKSRNPLTAKYAKTTFAKALVVEKGAKHAKSKIL